jgi:hypothetical protein
MGKKNPDLCERPRCRTRWTWLISGYRIHWKKHWTVRVCDHHAKLYHEGHQNSAMTGTMITLTRRSDP